MQISGATHSQQTHPPLQPSPPPRPPHPGPIHHPPDHTVLSGEEHSPGANSGHLDGLRGALGSHHEEPPNPLPLGLATADGAGETGARVIEHNAGELTSRIGVRPQQLEGTARVLEHGAHLATAVDVGLGLYEAGSGVHRVSQDPNLSTSQREHEAARAVLGPLGGAAGSAIGGAGCGALGGAGGTAVGGPAAGFVGGMVLGGACAAGGHMAGESAGNAVADTPVGPPLGRAALAVHDNVDRTTNNFVSDVQANLAPLLSGDPQQIARALGSPF